MQYFDKIKQCKSDSEKLIYNDSINIVLKHFFSSEDSYIQTFNIKNLGVTESPDKQFKIYNWNIPMSDFSNVCYGAIQYYYNREYQYEFLHDDAQNIDNPEKASLSANNWYGALYYQAIPCKDKGKKYYVLMGWRGKNEFTSQKVIESLKLGKKGVRFSSSVFKVNDEKVKRVIFEFSARISMMLRYDEHYKMIVYDHLSPSKPMYRNQYQYYGPDFSYNGLKYENGKWIEYKDIDLRSPDKKNKSKK